MCKQTKQYELRVIERRFENAVNHPKDYFSVSIHDETGYCWAVEVTYNIDKVNDLIVKCAERFKPE